MKQMSLAELQAFALQDPRAFVELLEENNVGKVKARLAANRARAHVADTKQPNRPDGEAMHVTPSGPVLSLAPVLIAVVLGLACWALIVALVAFIVRRILG